MRRLNKMLVVLWMASSLAFGACANQTKNNVNEKNETSSGIMETMAEQKQDKVNETMSNSVLDKTGGTMSDSMTDKTAAAMSDSMSDKAGAAMAEDMKDKTSMEEGAVLSDMEGNTLSLSSFRGKKLYVKFWASWCSICLAGLEEVDELSAEDNDFEVITIVSPNERGEKSKAEFIEWFNTLGYKNVKVLFDEDGSLIREYGVVAYPTSLYINEDGSNTELKIGHSSNDLIKENMDKLQ